MLVGHGDWFIRGIVGFGKCVGREFGEEFEEVLEGSLECFLRRFGGMLG